MWGSSRTTEIQHNSASACNIIIDETASVTKTDVENEGKEIWTEIGPSEADDQDMVKATPVSKLAPGTTVRIQPMDRNGGWSEEHFHHDLCLPSGSDLSRGIVVTLEAMATECVAIALSPTPYFSLGKTYAVHIGATSNLHTVIRRRLPSQSDEAVDISFNTPQVCSNTNWQKYWILHLQGKVSVGVGKSPGRNCIGTFDDTFYHALRSIDDAVRYVGLGNSALGRNAKDLKMRNVRVMSMPDIYDPLVGIELTEYNPLSIDSMSAEDAALWKEYLEECKKAEKRALKFGQAYKQPAPDAFFKWSEVQRLKANPGNSRGFITGLDIECEEEKEKANKRKRRFGNDNEENDDENVEDDSHLPLSEAWDNDEHIGKYRVDFPSYLLSTSGVSNEQDTSSEFTNEERATIVPEKIHLFAIDWAAFKQIRTDDIIAHFSIYGPTHCEWLSELSCNIWFEDKYSASRALNGLSRELPVKTSSKQENDVEMAQDKPIDTNNKEETADPIQSTDEAPQSHEEGQPKLSEWRFCNQPLKKKMTDRYGIKGTISRFLLRQTLSSDILVEKPTEFGKGPPGFTTQRRLGPGSDFPSQHSKSNNRKIKRGRNKRRMVEPSDSDEPLSLLDRGLSSTRDGFSVEEMERERSMANSNDDQLIN